MNCPVCGGENDQLQKEIAHRDVGVKSSIMVPACKYFCLRCNSEFLWIKGRRGLKILRRAG